ncbi:MAG: zinc ribbon domain-containing protein [Caldilineaceae bacterium]
MAVPVLWRTQKQRYALQAATCPHCTSAVFPPRAVCPYCKQPMAVRVQKPTPQGREFVYPLAVHVAAQPAAALVAAAGDD